MLWTRLAKARTPSVKIMLNSRLTWTDLLLNNTLAFWPTFTLIYSLRVAMFTRAPRLYLTVRQKNGRHRALILLASTPKSKMKRLNTIKLTKNADNSTLRFTSTIWACSTSNCASLDSLLSRSQKHLNFWKWHRIPCYLGNKRMWTNLSLTK
mgnify:CR=1 FL=1